MSDDSVRKDLEAAVAGKQDEATEPEESFEQVAARHLANGGSPESVHVLKLINTEFPYLQNERNQDWMYRALEYVARTNPTFFEREDVNIHDWRSVLAYFQSWGEKIDRKRETERQAQSKWTETGRRLNQLTELASKVDGMMANRRQH